MCIMFRSQDTIYSYYNLESKQGAISDSLWVAAIKTLFCIRDFDFDNARWLCLMDRGLVYENITGYLKNHWTKHRLVCIHFDAFSEQIPNMDVKFNNSEFFWKQILKIKVFAALDRHVGWIKNV